MPACSAYGCTNRPSKQITGITFHRFPTNVEQRQKWILAVRRKDWLPSKRSVLCSEHFSEDQIDRTSVRTVRLRKNAVPNIFKDFSLKHQIKKKSKKKPSKCIKKNSLLDFESSNLSTNSLDGTLTLSETDEPAVIESFSENNDPSSDSNSTAYSSLLSNSLNGISNFSNSDETTVREDFSVHEDPSSDSYSVANSSLLRDSKNETSNSSENDEFTIKENISEIRLLKKKLNIAENMLILYGKKIKTLHEKNQRYKNKVMLLTSLLCEIKENKCITDDELEVFLKICVSSMTQRAQHQELCSVEASEEFESE